MPSIKGVGAAFPPYYYDLAEVRRIGLEWLTGQTKNQELFDRFLLSSKAKGRNFAVPPSKILEIGGMEERAQLFETCGTELGTVALQRVLQEQRCDPEEVHALIFTSCSCPSIPSIDGSIVGLAGLDRTLLRIPIFQQGCAGGVVGLRLASELSKPSGLVSVTSVEICSLVFQRDSPTPAQLVGAAIFADGAASALISGEERGLVFRGTQSYLVPDSRHLMGYNLFDDGFHLRLDRDLPRALVTVASERVRSFLAEHQLQTENIAHWLFHPGGTKVLDFLESTFDLQPDQCHWARDVLSDIGNLSSATILLVVKAFLESKVSKPGDNILMMGVGPGLTLELILFEWVA